MKSPPLKIADIPRLLGTLALGLALWKICTGHDPQSWILGVPAALLFTWQVHANREQGPRLRFRRLPRFFIYFLAQSVRNGLDVSRRALHPLHEVQPGFTRYPSRLPAGAPRTVFANMISMLPGTLSWSLVDNVHKIHMLSGNPLIYEELMELESLVGSLYGIHLPRNLS